MVKNFPMLHSSLFESRKKNLAYISCMDIFICCVHHQAPSDIPVLQILPTSHPTWGSLQLGDLCRQLRGLCLREKRLALFNKSLGGRDGWGDNCHCPTSLRQVEYHQVGQNSKQGQCLQTLKGKRSDYWHSNLWHDGKGCRGRANTANGKSFYAFKSAPVQGFPELAVSSLVSSMVSGWKHFDPWSTQKRTKASAVIVLMLLSFSSNFFMCNLSLGKGVQPPKGVCEIEVLSSTL